MSVLNEAHLSVWMTQCIALGESAERQQHMKFQVAQSRLPFTAKLVDFMITKWKKGLSAIRFRIESD